MGVSVPSEHNLKGEKYIYIYKPSPLNSLLLWEGTVEKSDPQPCATRFVQEMDGYNLLLPQTRVFMVPPLGWGVKTVSRETGTFLLKSILKRGMRGAAESQGKEMVTVALSFFFFFFFVPGNEIILLVCLCGKYLLFVFPFFTHSHTCLCVSAGTKTTLT